MRLSVVVISWNEIDNLKTCLHYLMNAININLDEVVVVDNGSTDGTDQLMRSEYPMVRYHRLEKNIGVGPARNVGINMASGQFIMTLDNDTKVFGENIGEKVEAIFNSHSKIGLFAFRLLNEDGTVQLSARRFPNILQPFCARFAWIGKTAYGQRNLSSFLMKDIDLGAISGIIEVDWVLGANQIYRKSLFAQIGGYDEDIFFGPEDLYFCLQVWKRGLSVCYAPIINIEHTHKRRTRKFNMLMVKHFIQFYHLFWKEKRFWSLFNKTATPHGKPNYVDK